MLTGAVLISAASLGVGVLLGGFCVRASMDHLVREAQADRDLANLDAAQMQVERDRAQAELARWHDVASSPVSALLIGVRSARP